MLLKGERQNNFFNVCVGCIPSCCRGVRPPLTVRRRQIIEAYLKELGFHVENLFTQTGYVFPREDAEGYCIFFDRKTKRCQVHPVKPETCVAGPVTFDINVKNKKIEWHLKTEGSCLLAGAIGRDEKAFKKHLESAKREIFRLVSELDSESLKAILKIAEPETFKIGEDNIGEDVLDKLLVESKSV
jgi:Fe-S-cluster containining protein